MPRWPRWSALPLRTKGLTIVALPVLPLAVFWSITAAAFWREDAPANDAMRTLTVQAALAHVTSTLLDADAGARDHLLTDDYGALGRYRDAIDRLPSTLAKLNNAVIDPGLRTTLGTLDELVVQEVERLAELAGETERSALWTGERDALNSSAANLARVRELATSIEQGQARLAAARADRAQRRSGVIFGVLLVGSIVCVGSGVIAAIVVAGGLSRRIGTLTRNAERLARGETVRALPPGEDEIARLGERFTESAKLLRKLIAELRTRTAQLEAANHELEAFSYSVSHDLRAPLRAIDGFSQCVEEDYGDRLDDAGRDALRRVRAASQRMGQLIDGLLNLSRFTRAELRREPLDLGSTAAGVVEDLARHASGRQVDVRIEPNLLIEADPHLVRIALQNLIDNAFKYTGKVPRPRIEIGSSPNGRARVFHVRDNGAGFDPQYASKLFNAFQRLHNDHEFEGTGVGLAIVQRIVQRHGGKIWAQGAVNAGAAFYFTLEPEGNDQTS